MSLGKDVRREAAPDAETLRRRSARAAMLGGLAVAAVALALGPAWIPFNGFFVLAGLATALGGALWRLVRPASGPGAPEAEVRQKNAVRTMQLAATLAGLILVLFVLNPIAWLLFPMGVAFVALAACVLVFAWAWWSWRRGLKSPDSWAYDPELDEDSPNNR